MGKFFGTISTVAGETCPDFSNPSHCVDSHGYTDMTPNKFEGDWNHLAPYDVDQWNSTLHIDDDFGWATLTAITGYINFKREFYIDADATPTSDAEFNQNDAVSQFSQEIRLAGDTSGIAWLGGLYYSWDRVHSYTPGTLVDSFGLDAFIESRQITNSAAVFGQAKWPLTDQLTLTTGLRLTYEDRSYIGGTDFVIPGLGIHIPATHQDDKIFNRNVSWHGGLDYKPDDSTLIYLSVARATKSGGFFNGITTQNEALAPYKPETLTDYEAGVKAQLIDSTLLRLCLPKTANSHAVLQQVQIGASSIVLSLDKAAALEIWQTQAAEPLDDRQTQAHCRSHLATGETLMDHGATLIVTLPVWAEFRGGRAGISQTGQDRQTHTPDPALLKALARAHRWKALLLAGEIRAIEDLATRVGQERRHVGRTLSLAFLNPALTRRILRGEQPASLRLSTLLDADIPLSWQQQDQLFGTAQQAKKIP